MSGEAPLAHSPRTPIAVLGNGCAAMSLAAQADRLSDYALRVIAPAGEGSSQDHIWGTINKHIEIKITVNGLFIEKLSAGT